MRKVFCLGCLVLALSLAGKGWYWAKDGFHFNRIGPAFSSNQGKISALPSEIEPLLSQPYRYLGKGRQFYVFSSQDGKYVLKFPRMNQYQVPAWMRAFPFLEKYREEIARKKKARLDFLLESCRIAFEEIQDLTGILIFHFDQTKGSHFTQIFDSLGRSYSINLDRVPFVLQERQRSMATDLEQARQNGDHRETKKILESFLDLIAIRTQKGIFNKDHRQFVNYGYDGKKAFEIDIGSFYRVPGENSTKAAFRDTIDPIIELVQKTDPELKPWFQAKAKEFY